MSLTKREKILLYCLFMILIWGGGLQFILRPMAEHQMTLESQLSESESRRRMMEMSIADIPNIQKQLVDQSALAEKARGYIPYTIADYQEGKLLVRLAGEAGVMITAQENVDPITAGYEEIGVGTVSLTCNGSLDSAGAFMDLVNAQTNMAVVTYGFSYNGTDGETGGSPFDGYEVPPEVSAYSHEFLIVTYYDATARGDYEFEK